MTAVEGQKATATTFDCKLWLQYMGMAEDCNFYLILMSLTLFMFSIKPVQRFIQFARWGIF